MQAGASSPMLGSASRNLILSDLALEAAIEIEKVEAGEKAPFNALERLGQTLDQSTTGDLTLFPVYDRALAGTANFRATSKSDLYGRLRDITERMHSAASGSTTDFSLLREFCLALHDALLNYRIEHLHRPLTGPMTPGGEGRHTNFSHKAR
jgi:hypothetical protein